MLKIESYVINMVLKNHFLKDIFILCGQKIKKNRLIKKKSTDAPPIAPVEGDEEEVKEGKGIKILTWNKLLARFLILLAKIKAGQNS